MPLHSAQSGGWCRKRGRRSGQRRYEGQQSSLEGGRCSGRGCNQSEPVRWRTEGGIEQREAVQWSQAAQSTQGGAVMSGPTHWRLGRDQDGVEHQLKMGGWLDLTGVDMG